MLRLNVKQFMEAITGLEDYVPPIEAMKGVNYLHNTLYMKAVNGAPVRLADIDFSAFTLSDIEVFESYFDSSICEQNQTANNITDGLKRIPPATSKARFI